MERVENFVVCVKAALSQLCVRGWMFFQGEGISFPLVLGWNCCERNVKVVLVWVMGSRSSLRTWVFAGCHGEVVPSSGKQRLEGAGSVIICERLTALQDKKGLE